MAPRFKDSIDLNRLTRTMLSKVLFVHKQGQLQPLRALGNDSNNVNTTGKLYTPQIVNHVPLSGCWWNRGTNHSEL